MMAIFLYVELLGVMYYQRKVATAHARRSDIMERVQCTKNF